MEEGGTNACWALKGPNKRHPCFPCPNVIELDDMILRFTRANAQDRPRKCWLRGRLASPGIRTHSEMTLMKTVQLWYQETSDQMALSRALKRHTHSQGRSPFCLAGRALVIPSSHSFLVWLRKKCCCGRMAVCDLILANEKFKPVLPGLLGSRSPSALSGLGWAWRWRLNLWQ